MTFVIAPNERICASFSSPVSISIRTPASEAAYSFFRISESSFTQSVNAARSSAGIKSAALASRGIALSFNPPASDTIPMSMRSARYLSRRPNRILALPCSLSISLPEWPPASPVTVTVTARPCCVLRSVGITVSTVIPPAQLVRKCPSTSESIFKSLCPLSIDRSIASAPSMPISSSTVSTTSSLGCAITEESRMASAYATAILSRRPYPYVPEESKALRFHSPRRLPL